MSNIFKMLAVSLWLWLLLASIAGFGAALENLAIDRESLGGIGLVAGMFFAIAMNQLWGHALTAWLAWRESRTPQSETPA